MAEDLAVLQRDIHAALEGHDLPVRKLDDGEKTRSIWIVIGEMDKSERCGFDLGEAIMATMREVVGEMADAVV